MTTAEPEQQPEVRSKFPKHLSPFRSKLRKFRKNIFVSLLIDLVVILGSALIISLLIKTFLVRSFFIPSGSMLETLQIDDRIIVNELVPEVIPINRGDVVVFRDPGGWFDGPVSTEKDLLSASVDWFLSAFGIIAPDSSQHLVKRVIGIGGDDVVCCDENGKIVVNGISLDEPYVSPDQPPSQVTFEVYVPDGSLWVMGDNRSNSEDSRYHLDLPSKGFVGEEFVVGRAFVVSWPFEHWKWLDNYSEIFEDAGDP